MAVKRIKRVMSLLLAVMLVVAGSFAVPTSANAADERYVEEIEGVRYVKYKEYDNENYPPLGIEPGRPGGAPEYSGVNDDYGFLFAGWFVKREGLYTPLQAKGDVREGEEVYAKYVPANVLSVKCQNQAETSQSTPTTNIKLISSVDSLNYRTIGFELYRISIDGQYYKTTTIGSVETKWTYDYLFIYGQNVADGAQQYAPSDVFGGAAKYFTTWQLSNIAQENYSKIIGVRPFWVTMDGVKVYGLSRYMHVEDGYLNYVNVPVNLHNAKDVAAGMLEFTYDTSKYTLKNVECGRVFEELTTMERTEGTIECVANASKAVDKMSNDLYVNIRLIPKTVSTGINESEFEVSEESFANYNEEEFNGSEYNVWKIKTGFIKH